MTKPETLDNLLMEVRGCTLCADHLPLGPRPVVRMQGGARILIVGQAPGTKVHETGIPWNDASGDRLRDWLSLSKDIFYDETKIAIMPMGFCYPGRDPKGGDKPPRPECARTWHDRLLLHLPDIDLTLLVGSYAQKRYLGSAASATMTESVRNFRTHLSAGFLPLPHPSWRTTAWQRKNPWFDEEVLPVLRSRVGEYVA
ncbi:uracil-DNA glycosylase family protein [Rhodospirillaceae bacterium KN72]|uniref:Uracil-DNA glycosylase family protein n=1 Tax=Pacificispira spongiicola TaxID=2729598 RepID=A0A7Y0E182_9PROT|nr:uracil-DNA glycosylase family protein [Pacificispira spongiicola]NMM45373.1 uracil-DNA glycosylase family protein [Pacificispira spongiicola]